MKPYLDDATDAVAPVLRDEIAALERCLSSSSSHSDARRALQLVRAARGAATPAKAVYLVIQAVIAAKDFQLYADAVAGEPITSGRSKGGKATAKMRATTARADQEKFAKAARALFESEPDLSNSEIARRLRPDAPESARRKLSKLLPRRRK